MTAPRPFRKEKLASILQHELGTLIVRELDLKGALLTITRVTILDKNPEITEVRVSILPHEKGPETFRILEKRKGMLQFKLIRKMNVRTVPSLHFLIDEAIKES